MLYSIIPPIVVILSLIGIIIFLVKKSSKVAEIDIAEAQNFPVAEEDKNLKEKKLEKAKKFLLVFLEKITKFFKVIFLKLEIKFSNWSYSLRKNREKQLENKKEEETISKVKSYNLEELKVEREEIKKDIQDVENEIKPMLKDEIVEPKTYRRISRVPEIKNQMEEALIERIAVNPKDVEAYERLGEYYLDIKEYKDAKECYKQVIKLNPSNRSVRYKMRRLENLLSN